MTIDLTDRYNQERYMRNGTGTWWLNRETQPVTAVVMHHSAGYYGAFTGTAAGEVTQLDRMAADHRERFGIGPGYHYAAFPSGRLYAIGKYGTQRAHTKGRDPAVLRRWNEQAIGVVAMGDYELSPPTGAMVAALLAATHEVTLLSRAAGQPVPEVYFHGLVPTVTMRGQSYSQSTACPGQWLRQAYHLAPPEAKPVPRPSDAPGLSAFEQRRAVYRAGYVGGYRAAMLDVREDANERLDDGEPVVPAYRG